MIPARAALILLLVGFVGGCVSSPYDLERATRTYPRGRHVVIRTNADGLEVRQPRAVDIQVFRQERVLLLMNSTARSYWDVDVWVNQRFVHPLAKLPAGKLVRMQLNEFYDERGEQFGAGGFFRTTTPTPVRLVELELDAEQPLVGLITIRAEDPQSSE